MTTPSTALGQTMTMRYRMSDRDVFYGGGVVNGARSITYMSDVAERLMVKLYGKLPRCLAIKRIRLYQPVFAGDYLEFIGKVTETDGAATTIEVRSFKLAIVPENPPFASSIDMLEDPVVSTVAVFQYEPIG